MDNGIPKTGDLLQVGLNNREFSVMKMNAFDALKLVIRLKDVFSPVLTKALSNEKGVLNAGVDTLVPALCEGLKEEQVEQIILPMLIQSKTWCMTKKRYISSLESLHVCFPEAGDLLDLVELAFHVARYQCGPFLEGLMARFGGLTKEQETQQPSQES